MLPLFFFFLIILGFFFFSITAGFTILLKMFYRKKYIKPSASSNIEEDPVPEIRGVAPALSEHIRDKKIMVPLLEAKQRTLSKVESDTFYKLTVIGTRATILIGDMYIANDSKAPNKPKKIVILVHGYSDSSAGMAYLAEEYLKIGINVLAVNCRGHGLSEGKLAGIAKRDARDLVSWIEALVKKFGTDCEVYLHGVSMGAATVLQYLAIHTKDALKYQNQIKGVVSDCAFSCFSKQLVTQMSYVIGCNVFQKLVSRVLIFGTSFANFILNGFFFFQSSPVKALKSKHAQQVINRIPILLFHGEKDKLVSSSMSTELFNSIKNYNDKYLFTVKNAPHIGSYFYDRDSYIEKINKYLFKIEKDR